MQYLVIYDISHDGARTKVADVCLDYGLERIQYSAFVGRLNKVHQRELVLKMKHAIGKNAARIQLFPLDEACWSGRQMIEQNWGK